MYPDTNAAYPDTDAAYPDTDAAYPDTDAAYPNTDAAYPDTDAAYPKTDAAYPDTDAAYPDTDTTYPGRDASVTQEPVTQQTQQTAHDEAPPLADPPVADPPVARARWRPPDWSKPAVMHKPRLEMHAPGCAVRSRQVGSSRAFIIGRNGQVADIILEDSSVSRAQAALINSSAAIYLQAPT